MYSGNIDPEPKSTPGTTLQNILSVLVVHSEAFTCCAVSKAVDKHYAKGWDITQMCDSVCKTLIEGRASIPSIDDVDLSALLGRHVGHRDAVTRIVFARLVRKLWDDVVSRLPESIAREDFNTAWVIECVDWELKHAVIGVAAKDDDSSWHAARRISSLAEGDEVLSRLVAEWQGQRASACVKPYHHPTTTEGATTGHGKKKWSTVTWGGEDIEFTQMPIRVRESVDRGMIRTQHLRRQECDDLINNVKHHLEQAHFNVELEADINTLSVTRGRGCLQIKIDVSACDIFVNDVFFCLDNVSRTECPSWLVPYVSWFADNGGSVFTALKRELQHRVSDLEADISKTGS
eukprot:PhM_4_TR2052/c4_g1_i1/m.9966